MAKPVLIMKEKEPSFEVLNLRDVRQQIGFTLQELADLVGFSKGYISDIENGRRSVPSATAVRLREVVSLAWDAKKGKRGRA